MVRHHQTTVAIVVVFAMALSVILPYWHRHDHGGSGKDDWGDVSGVVAMQHHCAGCGDHAPRHDDGPRLAASNPEQATHNCLLCIQMSQRPTLTTASIEKVAGDVRATTGARFCTPRVPVCALSRLETAPRGPPPFIA